MISVIIPVYNSRKFLRQCLDSVLTQDFSDFEVVAVDDGSTDDSGVILDEIAAADSRLRVIHTSNCGLSAARNKGIDAAQGEWLTFVDSDDVLLPRALARMNKSVSGNGDSKSAQDATTTDVVFYRWLQGTEAHCNNKDIAELASGSGSVYTLTGFQAAEDVTYRYRGLEPTAWAKLYRRELFDGLRFTAGTWYEDVDFTYRLLLKAHKVAVSNDVVYFYRQHPASFLHVWNHRRLDILTVTDRMLDWCGEHCPALLPAARDRRFSAYYNIFVLASRNGQYDVARSCWDVIRQYRREVLFSRKTRFKNRMGALLSYAGSRIAKVMALGSVK